MKAGHVTPNFYLNKCFVPFRDAHWERTVQDIPHVYNVIILKHQQLHRRQLSEVV